MEELSRKLDSLEGRVELLESSLEKHNNLLYGVNYLNVPGVADKIEALEKSIKRGFWLLVITMIIGWLATILVFVGIVLATRV